MSEGAIIPGEVVSETIIDWVFETVLPARSVTYQITVLLPNPIIPPFEAIVYDAVKVEQLSVAEATPITIEQVLEKISAGIVKTGSSLSTTLIVWLTTVILPAVSVTVHVKMLLPLENNKSGL